MSKLKLLVTGGAGFIGSNFIHYILQERTGWEVVNLDKLTYAGNLENLEDIEDHPNYHFIKGDIGDRVLIDKLFRERHFDVIVNFAAESHVDRSILDAAPFIGTNVLGTQVLLEAARKYKTSCFVQISTDEVYGSIKEGKFVEDSPLRPSSPYAASKASADLLCHAYYKTYGLPIIIARSSNNYGPYQFPEKFIPLMITNAIQGKSLPVYGKGENVRDWLYVKDNCQAIALLIERGQFGEVYNIGGGEEWCNMELVEYICELLALRLQRSALEFRGLITTVRDRPGHDFRYSLDCSKIQRELGWAPTTKLEDGLKMTIDWYLGHQSWLHHVTSTEYQTYYTRVYEQGWR